MFALIITIISIALVAALALATIYYGGTAFNRNSTEIKAAEIMLQQQQIRAALSLYKADHEGAAPQNLQTLITSNYLRQIPSYAFNSPDPSLIPTAHAAESIPWVMPAEFNATFVLAENVSPAVCAEVNYKSRAYRGVPNQLYTSLLPIQCYYSASKQSNIVVVTDDIATVTQVLTGTGVTPTNPTTPFSVPSAELNTTALATTTTPAIDPADTSKWQNPPSEFTGSNSGSSGGTGSTGSTGGTGGTGGTPIRDLIAECASGGWDCLVRDGPYNSYTRDFRIRATGISTVIAHTETQVNWENEYSYMGYNVSILCPSTAAYHCSFNPGNRIITITNWNPTVADSVLISMVFTYVGNPADNPNAGQGLYGLWGITTTAPDDDPATNYHGTVML